MVVEADRDHYAFQRPYILMPDMADSDIADPLIDEHYFPIIPIAQGLIIGTANNGAAVTSLLNTSESAFSKADGYNITTYEKEDDDTDDIYFTNNKSNDSDEILALDTAKIKNCLSTVGSVKHTDYVTYNAVEDEINRYGLDDPELTINISCSTENKDKDEVENSFKLDISTVDDNHYLRINDSRIIYSLSAAVDGKSIALVPRRQTVDLIEAVNAIVLGKNSTEK